MIHIVAYAGAALLKRQASPFPEPIHVVEAGETVGVSEYVIYEPYNIITDRNQFVYVAESGATAVVTTELDEHTSFYLDSNFLYAAVTDSPHAYISFQNSGTSCGIRGDFVFTTSDSNKCSSEGPFSISVADGGELVYGSGEGSFQVCGEDKHVSLQVPPSTRNPIDAEMQLVFDATGILLVGCANVDLLFPATFTGDS